MSIQFAQRTLSNVDIVCKLFLRLPCRTFGEIAWDTSGCSAQLTDKSKSLFLGKESRHLINGHDEIDGRIPCVKASMWLLHSIPTPDASRLTAFKKPFGVDGCHA